MASGYFDRDGWFIRPVHTSRRELQLENIHDLDGTIMAEEGIELNSRIWLNRSSDWPHSVFRWTLIIAPDRNEFIDELLETEHNVPHIIKYFRRSYHDELQTDDSQPTLSLIAQTVIERAALKIRQWKRKRQPEEGFSTAHLTLVPVIAAMFELEGEQKYYFKKAMRWLSCAPLELHMKLLCAAPDMPFELILHQLNKTIETMPTAGKRMSALGKVIHRIQLASDISPECTTCDEDDCPGPLIERHELVSQPALCRSIIDRTFQMVDCRNWENFICYISTFRFDSEIYCVHKLLPLLETGISEKQDVPEILYFMVRLSSVSDAIPISTVKMLFTELTPLICKDFDSTLVFNPALRPNNGCPPAQRQIEHWGEQPCYELIQEYLKACLRLRLPDCALVFFLRAAEVMITCIGRYRGWYSRFIPDIGLIRFLKEVAEDVVNLDPSTELYRAYQRFMPKLFNTYLDHVVGQEPGRQTTVLRALMVCDRTPRCTTCSAVNAFLIDPDRVSSRYVIEAEEFTHMKPSLETRRAHDSVGDSCTISYGMEIWHDGLRWTDVTLSKDQIENLSHRKWEARVRHTEEEFEFFSTVPLKKFLGEAYERTVTMSRIRNRKHTQSFEQLPTAPNSYNTESSNNNTMSVPLLNGETVIVPFRKIGTTHVPMFRGSASVAVTPSDVPQATQPKRKRPKDPLAETDKRQRTDPDKRNPPCTRASKSSSGRRTRAAQEQRVSEDVPWFFRPTLGR